MKAWVGVMGRSILEFLIAFAGAAFVSGAFARLQESTSTPPALLAAALASVPSLFPAMTAAALFLAMSGFERRLRSRAAGWLGLVALGAILSAAGLAVDRVPALRGLFAPGAARSEAAPAPLQAPGLGVETEGVLVWYRAAEGGTALDAVAVDYRAPFPRLAYAALAPLDPAGGSIRIGAASYPARKPPAETGAFLPELAFFAGHWAWDRVRTGGELPLAMAAAAAAGFVLLAAGFRFFARLTRWPLANAFFGAAAFLGFLLLDASLWSPAVSRAAGGLASRAGLGGLSLPYLLAAVEAILGLLLALVDLAVPPRGREDRG